MESALLRLRRPLGRHLQPRTLLALGLLLILMRTVTAGLANALQGLGQGQLLPAALLGLLVAWLLASTKMPGRLAGALLLALGALFVLLQAGRLANELFALAGPLARLLWDVALWGQAGPPDTGPLLQALVELWQSLGVLLARLRSWLSTLASGDAPFDPVAGAVFWSLLLWVTSIWASWYVRHRRRPLLAMLPAIAITLFTLGYSRQNLTGLYVMLGGTLLLMTLVRHIVREQRWDAEGTDYASEIGRDVGCASLIVTAALLAMAALAPSISMRRLLDYVQDLTRPNESQDSGIASSLGLKRPASDLDHPFEAVVQGGLPRSHLVGSGPELSERIVMSVTLEESARPAADETPPNMYWRSLTYDSYTGRGWKTSKLTFSTYEPGQRVIPAEPTRHRQVRQEVRISEDLGSLLHVTGELVTADREFSVGWREPGDLFGATIEANAYRADSLVPIVDEVTLRAAGEDYPQWIKDQFLQLPEDLPSRVISLALDLTATEPTPYDRARAIESYLRTFPYSLDVSYPPIDRDTVDFFLFSLQTGYCDYYSSSMVVLARAAGIPARMAIGYIGGIYDAEEGRYLVSEAEAHSWVEVYFPEVGWITFEPTAGRPALEREETQLQLEVPPELEAPLPPLETASTRWARIGRMALASALGALGLLGLAWLAADYIRLRRMPVSEAVTTLYRRSRSYGSRLETAMNAGDTPSEYARALGGRVEQLARRIDARLQVRLSPAMREIQQLAELVVLAQFSPYALEEGVRQRALQTWTRLRRRLLTLWVWTRISPSHRRKPLPPTGRRRPPPGPGRAVR